MDDIISQSGDGAKFVDGIFQRGYWQTPLASPFNGFVNPQNKAKGF